MDNELSKLLDEARLMETRYRALLLHWKKRRQRLEAQIHDPVFDEISQICNDAWGCGDEPGR